MTNRCVMCKNFSRYYTKDTKQFDETDFGWCSRARRCVNIHELCNAFTLRPPLQISDEFLEEHLTELLTEICKILDTQTDDSENFPKQ